MNDESQTIVVPLLTQNSQKKAKKNINQLYIWPLEF
jgi:hypothetical protein